MTVSRRRHTRCLVMCIVELWKRVKIDSPVLGGATWYHRLLPVSSWRGGEKCSYGVCWIPHSTESFVTIDTASILCMRWLLELVQYDLKTGVVKDWFPSELKYRTDHSNKTTHCVKRWPEVDPLRYADHIDRMKRHTEFCCRIIQQHGMGKNPGPF